MNSETRRDNVTQRNNLNGLRTAPEPTPIGKIVSAFRKEQAVAVCDIHGQYEGESLILPNGGRVNAECPECKAERLHKEAAEQEEEERLRKEQEWESKMKSSRIGKRYWNDSLDTWKAGAPEQKRILELCRQYASNFNPDNGKGLFFKGAAGTGKTHLSVGISKAVMKKGYSARYCTLSQLLSGMRACYGQAATMTEDEFYFQMVGYDLLVIDEIGVKTISGDEFNTLYRVVDERYMECRCTILAANTEKTDAETLLTDRIIDRLNETSLTVVFNWASYRGKK